MKKIYMTPEVEAMNIQPVQMLSGSVTVGFEDEVVDDITFSGHEDAFDFGEDDTFTFEEESFVE